MHGFFVLFFVVKKLLQKTNAFSSTAIIYSLFFTHTYVLRDEIFRLFIFPREN
ncbi:VanZ family protein [uncultured Treponema sp.]|uniref:VanZ family protein n=1 Tax=uncultured Treponema sp. TaxID=162155 RepID=UPI0015AA183F